MSIKLLRYLEPYPDESILNYIYRISIENACSVEWLLKELNLNTIKYKATLNFVNSSESICIVQSKSVTKRKGLYFELFPKIIGTFAGCELPTVNISLK
ncbi:MAG: hypothetical protein A2Y23_04225 [Clostridiales bacterium GWB2_37_7]|nr:MAG: hypothetical protein A2Y23_04225 [Clostridiales bacterium GWB2_37_7]